MLTLEKTTLGNYCISLIRPGEKTMLRKALMGLSYACLGAVVILTTGAADEEAKAEEDQGGRCVVLYEGNDCTDKHSSCCTTAGPKLKGCWRNDEARSMMVYGPSKTVLTVFDDKKANTRRDYFVLIKGDDEPVCVGSFDNPSVSLGKSSHKWFYSGGKGLDGKVSTFAWSDPRL